MHTGVPNVMSIACDRPALADRRQLILGVLGTLAIGAAKVNMLAASDLAILPHSVAPVERAGLLPATDDSTVGTFIEATLHVMMG